jgi:hypothetical protein
VCVERERERERARERGERGERRERERERDRDGMELGVYTHYAREEGTWPVSIMLLFFRLLPPRAHACADTHTHTRTHTRTHI